MLDLFKKRKPIDIPEDYIIKCNNCNEIILSSRMKKNYYICPSCNFNQRIRAIDRIEFIVDNGTFKEKFKNNKINDYLNFNGYKEKIKKLQFATDMDEAVICGTAKIDGKLFCIGVMDSNFLMGSMGSVVGEKITKLFEYATANKLAVVLYTASGGARMQEGIISLMQMAKITQALKHHSNNGLFYMPILTDPTTGGVTASFAMLGDIIISEPKTLIAFAGPRVIEQTINTKLPEGFQSAEFLLEHGYLDKIVARSEQRSFINKMIHVHCKEK